MKNPEELSKEQLTLIVQKIQSVLYKDIVLDDKNKTVIYFSRYKSWTNNTLIEIDELMEVNDLSPSPVNGEAKTSNLDKGQNL